MIEPSKSERRPYEQSFYPPVPTPFTKRMRTNLLWQFFRFVVLNIKMLRMVRKH
ncbi:MAG TPA: hypothetical protein VG077_02680 [Verrucomicrobiae bacterium]|nr:hypothetical protein [Verrucomicrobiae bacterium]